MTHTFTLPGRCRRCGGIIDGRDRDYCKFCLGGPMPKSKTVKKVAKKKSK